MAPAGRISCGMVKKRRVSPQDGDYQRAFQGELKLFERIQPAEMAAGRELVEKRVDLVEKLAESVKRLIESVEKSPQSVEKAPE